MSLGSRQRILTKLHLSLSLCIAKSTLQINTIVSQSVLFFIDEASNTVGARGVVTVEIMHDV